MGKVIMSGRVPKLTAPSNLPAIGTALNDMEWAEIRAISDAGQAANYFAVGDTKSIVINGTVGLTAFDNLAIDVFILGIDHNANVEGTNRIHFQIGKIGGIHVALVDSAYASAKTESGYFNMNPSRVNTGGWESSHMRTTILGSDSMPTNPTENTLMSALPADLLAVMKPVTKYSDNSGGGTNTASYVTATEDYFPLLSEWEVFGTRTSANSAEQNYQTQYDYYKAGNSKVRYKHNATTTAAHWWCRSVYSANSVNFCRVTTGGNRDNTYANVSCGISPIFAV